MRKQNALGQWIWARLTRTAVLKERWSANVGSYEISVVGPVVVLVVFAVVVIDVAEGSVGALRRHLTAARRSEDEKQNETKGQRSNGKRRRR